MIGMRIARDTAPAVGQIWRHNITGVPALVVGTNAKTVQIRHLRIEGMRLHDQTPIFWVRLDGPRSRWRLAGRVTPGSPAGVSVGCTCPPAHNRHGRFKPSTGWVISDICPIHQQHRGTCNG